MTNPPPKPSRAPVWVFHRGALGDSVLLWPLLRRLRAESSVTLVTDRARAELAAVELGVQPVDIETPRFNALWTQDAAPVSEPSAARVLSFITTDQAGVWATNARLAFPNATIELLAAPISRPKALEFGQAFSCPPPRHNPSGPVVLHVGAGSHSKRWPLDHWLRLAALLAHDHAVQLLAGEVEQERFTITEFAAFAQARGLFVDRLDRLANTLRGAKLFIGADSGPTHLAAQLGLPTIALFGPTDPAIWAPIGPRVITLAPRSPAPMDWLSVEDLHRSVREHLPTPASACPSAVGPLEPPPYHPACPPTPTTRPTSPPSN